MKPRYRLAPNVDAVRVGAEIWLISTAASVQYLARLPAGSIDETALAHGRGVALTGSETDIAMTLAQLDEHRLIERATSETIAGGAWPAFVPTEIRAGQWTMRAGNEILLFRANASGSLAATFATAACSFAQPEFQLAAKAILEGTFSEVSSAVELPVSLAAVMQAGTANTVVSKLAVNSELGGLRPRVSEWWERLPAAIVRALNRIAAGGNPSPLFQLIPMIADARTIHGKPSLSCDAVLSRHRSLELGAEVPMQIGRDADGETAATKAAIESLERLCGQTAPDSASKFTITRTDLVKDFPLERFPRTQQWRNSADGASTRGQDEMQCVEINEGETRLPCPVDFVYFGRAVEHRERLFNANSSGMAAHFDFERAVESGFFELIERDALMVHWLTMRSPPRLVQDGHFPQQQRAIQNINGWGYDVHLLDLTLDLAPVVAAVALNRKKRFPYFICGAGCAPTRAQACDRAVAELETSLWAMIGRTIDPIRREAVTSPSDHAAFYANPENAGPIEFLLSGSRATRVPGNDGAIWNESTSASAQLRRRGFRCFVKDITARQVADLTRVTVVRTLVTELLPIQFGFHAEISEPTRIGKFGSLRNRPEAPHFFS